MTDFRRTPGRRDAILAERQRLYDAGMNDREISRAQGVLRTSVRCWRDCRGLPANAPSKVTATPVELARLRELHSEGHSDILIARMIGRSKYWSHKWRVRLGLQRNYEPLHFKGNGGYRRSTKAAQTIRIASCAEVSLDAPMQFGMPLGHTIKDDAMSGWLEEMGATVW